MAELKPYTLEQQQSMVSAALERAKPRHRFWRTLEAVFRHGSLEEAQQAGVSAQELFPELDRQVVNMILPHVSIMLASIVARDPQLLAEPIGGGPEAEAAATTAEAVVQYFWKRSYATDKLRQATQDALLIGNGFLKTGWVTEDRAATEDDPEWHEAEAVRVLEEVERFGEVFEEEPDGFEPPRLPVLDEPFVEYASPYDVFVPPNASRMEDTRWVCHRVTLPIDEVEANPMFSAPDGGVLHDGLQSGTSEDEVAEWKRKHRDETGVSEQDESMRTATLFEFYDMRTRRLTVWQLHADGPLYDDVLPYSHRHPPFVHLGNYRPNGTEFWGFGDLENVARVQAIHNEMVGRQLDSTRRSGAKYLVHEDAWTTELEQALESDVPDVVARVQAPNGMPLEELIHMVQREGLPAEVYETKVEFEEFIRKILGINDFQAGGMGADRMSATAAAVVDGVASLRSMDKVAAVERAASQVGLHLLLLCQEFLEEPRVVRIASDDGAVAWPEVSSDDLVGEYLVSIEGGSTKAVNPQTREERGRKLMVELLPVVAQLGMDPMPLLRSGIRDMGFNPDVVLRPAPQPQAPPDGAGGPPAEGAGPPPADVGGPEAALAAQLGGGLPL